MGKQKRGSKVLKVSLKLKNSIDYWLWSWVENTLMSLYHDFSDTYFRKLKVKTS